MAAARLAEGRGALDEALVLWEQALQADQLAASADLRRRYDVLLGLGQARARRGAVTESRAALQEAIDIGQSLDDVVLVAQAATSFRGGGIWHWREMGTFDQQLVEVLQDCAAALAPGPLLARVLSSLSMELMYQWRSAEADELGEQSVQMAREYGDRELFCDVASMRVMAANCRPGGAEQQLALIAEVLANEPSREQELYVRFLSAPAHMQRGDVEEADRQVTRCLELVRRLRHTGADVPLAWWRFFRAAERGERELADRLAEEAAVAARRQPGRRAGRARVLHAARGRPRRPGLGRRDRVGPGAPQPGVPRADRAPARRRRTGRGGRRRSSATRSPTAATTSPRPMATACAPRCSPPPDRATRCAAQLDTDRAARRRDGDHGHHRLHRLDPVLRRPGPRGVR